MWDSLDYAAAADDDDDDYDDDDDDDDARVSKLKIYQIKYNLLSCG